MKMRGKQKIWFVVLAIVVFFVGIGIVVHQYRQREALPVLSYPAFLEKLESGEVAEVALSEDPELIGTLKNGDRFIFDNPRSENLKEMLLIRGVGVKEVRETYPLSQIILFILVIGAFIGLAIYLSKTSSKQASKEYDRMSSVEYATGEKTGITFENIAGNEEAKENLMELVDFLKNPEKYAFYGAKMPRGVILYGPPGTGKTLMAKALATEAGVGFLAVSGSDFVQIYAGVGAARIRDIFKQAANRGKCVIFIDEIDAIGKKRDRGGMGGSDEADRTLNALLAEMSGFKGNEGIIVLAATNRLDTLDEALLRPGRFDRQIEVGLPDYQARRAILSLYTRNRPVEEGVDLNALAHQTVYFSGAKLENLVNEAAIYAAKESAKKITRHHLEQAFHKVVAGEEKKDRSSICRRDREITAYHEAGHAAVTKLLCPENRITKVSIIPSTNGAGGYSMNIPPDRLFHTKRNMLNHIKVALGGRIAEELVFGPEEITTGASNDIQRATETLAAMVKRFGMSSELGMLNYEVLSPGYGEVDQNLVKLLSEEMNKLYQETKALLKANFLLIQSIAEGLLRQEVLNEKEIEAIYLNYQKMQLQ